jgi:hypothetical protein
LIGNDAVVSGQAACYNIGDSSEIGVP